MTNDAAGQRDNTVNAVLDLLPPELLPIHQRLEHDGGSWRASLPPADMLLHRLRAHPSRNAQNTQNMQNMQTAHEDRVTLRSATIAVSASPPPRPPALHPRNRRKDPYR